MGLDVTAYQKLEAIEDEEDDVEIAVSGDDIVSTEQLWLGRTAGLSAADYTLAPGSISKEFRAGSYSGYGEWRRELCKLVHGLDPETLWGREQELATGPFTELINFSDCEGVLGPVVCAKLAQDFADFQDKANEFGNAWFSEHYAMWRLAFELAGGGNGAVRFH